MKSIYNLIRQITLYYSQDKILNFNLIIENEQLSVGTMYFHELVHKKVIHDYFEMGARSHPQNQNINENFISNLKLIILEK